MPRVTVVIPNWNGLAHLPECTEALAAQEFRDFETVVVDNASTDGSADWLESQRPEVRVLVRADNGGFSAAVNEGIRSSNSPLVALLNNDTAADPRWLAELVAALDANPDYDMAASLMLMYDDPGVVNAAGDVFNFQFLDAHNRGLGLPVAHYTTPIRVLGACAGAALYRRSLFEDVGYFDESFFLMHEDTDLNIRALVRGKRCVFVPSARVRHKLGASIDSMPSLDSRRMQQRNEGVVVGKDLPWELLALVPLVRPWSLLRSTVLVKPSVWPGAGRRVRDAIAVAGAWNQGLRIGLSRRRELWPRRGAPRLEILRWLLKGTGTPRQSGGTTRDSARSRRA